MEFTDQMGNKIGLTYPPQRIISLVPSQTELLFDLGLGDQAVGITKFCIHPKQWRDSKTIVGGTKNFHFDTIDQLKPDLIIGNKEENYVEGIEQLKRDYPVWMSDIVSIDDALSMIRAVSLIADQEKSGIKMLHSIQDSFEKLKPVKPLRTLYLMWRDPWMGVANRTFIHSMIERIGLINALENEERYPAISDRKLIELDPSLVLLSSEPYPFAEKHIAEITKILPKAKVVLVDGETFSWYGSRMRLFPAYVNSLGL